MSTLANWIGQALARAKLAQARVLGTTVAFSHRGAAPVTLYAELPASGQGLELTREGQAATEERVLALRIPTGQAGFAAPTGGPEPVTPGDAVAYLGRTYYVQAPIQTEAHGHVYVLRGVERRRLASGGR